MTSVIVSDINAKTDWRPALAGVDAVVHTVARVHVMREVAADPLAAYRALNVEATLALARQAARSGVRRFVFVSSVKVNGERTESRAYTADDIPAPVDPYGVSKREAEDALFALSRETSMEVVVVRPVLVYGPGVRANFRAMMAALRRGLPLPFGAIRNRRSLVGRTNLVDLIALCLHHPRAAGEVFLAADGDDLSTPELLWRTAKALGTSPILVPVPPQVIRTVAALLGRSGMAQRLCDSLQADIAKNRTLLGWSPPASVDEELAATARSFLGERH